MTIARSDSQFILVDPAAGDIARPFAVSNWRAGLRGWAVAALLIGALAVTVTPVAAQDGDTPADAPAETPAADAPEAAPEEAPAVDEPAPEPPAAEAPEPEIPEPEAPAAEAPAPPPPAPTPPPAPAAEPPKPNIDSSQNVGVTRNDVRNIGKESTERVAPRPQARRAPAPRTRANRPGPVQRPAEAAAAIRDGGFLSGSPYIWGSLGWANPDDADVSGLVSGTAELASSIQYGGAVGWHFDNNFRAELEINYFSVDVDRFMGVSTSGDVEALSGMVNVLYEWPRFRLLKPYLGGGIGLTGVEFSGPMLSGDDTVFAYQLIVGTAVEATRSFALTFDYRYFGGGDPEFSGGEAEMSGHKLLAGMRYTFGR